MLNYVKASAFGINFGEIPLHFSAYSFIIAIVAMIAVSSATKKTSAKILDETQTGWFISQE
jgi:Mg2+ and Co2+ transporter CorA